MKNIWFTSDTHYGHVNISSKSASTWKSGYRDFKTIHQMNRALVDGINKYVKEDDILYHLGDWSFGGKENILLFRQSLVCKNIHLILGNHDQHIEEDMGKYSEHFASIGYSFRGYIGKTFFHLDHFAHRVWFKSHKGSIHLYGHSHATIPDFGKSMDVGVDVAYKMFGEYRPFNLEEILRIMDKKEIHKIDHH